MTLVVFRVIGWIHVVVMVGVLELFAQFFLAFLEGVGDVFQEDQAQYYVLIDSSIEVGAQLVGGGPELFFELVEELLFDWVHCCFPDEFGAGVSSWMRCGSS